MNQFKFLMRETVRIICSHETGEVIARAEHLNAENQYLVRYRAADGRAVEIWWSSNALDHASDVARDQWLERERVRGVPPLLDAAHSAAVLNAMASDVRTAAEVIDSEFTANASDTGGGGGVDEAKPAVADDLPL